MVAGINAGKRIAVNHDQPIPHDPFEKSVQLPQIVSEQILCRPVAKRLLDFVKAGQLNHGDGVGPLLAIKLVQ